jgi:DNA repair protein RecO (recombination protein O)
MERSEGERVDRTLATLVQACVHLLALGGYGLPLQTCCRSGAALSPPIGNWDWRCSLLADEGLAIGAQAGAAIQINPSELALLQRLTRLELPERQDGGLMGPRPVWLRLFTLVECWCRVHLPRPVRSFAMVREAVANA